MNIISVILPRGHALTKGASPRKGSPGTSWFAIGVVVFATVIGNSSVQSQSPASPLDPVRSWNELALQTVRVRSASDSRAARLYAMVNVAIYDAVNGIITRHGAHEGRDHALVPPTGAPPQGHLYAAAAAAAHAVLAGEFPDLKVALYDPQLASDLAALGPGGQPAGGQEWGAYVGAQVRAARANDGSSPTESQAAGSGPGQFRASWSGVQFRNLVPFGIADSSIYVGGGPPPLDSLDYAGAFPRSSSSAMPTMSIRESSTRSDIGAWAGAPRNRPARGSRLR